MNPHKQGRSTAEPFSCQGVEVTTLLDSMGLDGSLIFVPTSYLVGEILSWKKIMKCSALNWFAGPAAVLPRILISDLVVRVLAPNTPHLTDAKQCWRWQKDLTTECMNTKVNTNTTPSFDGFRPHPNSGAVFLLATTGPWTHLGNMIWNKVRRYVCYFIGPHKPKTAASFARKSGSGGDVTWNFRTLPRWISACGGMATCQKKTKVATWWLKTT